MQRELKVRFFGLALYVWCVFAPPLSAENMWCEYKNVLPKEGTVVPLRVSRLTLTSIHNSAVIMDPVVASIAEATTGEVSVVSQAQKRVIWFLLVVEFAGSAGEPLSIPLFNVGVSREADVNFRYIPWSYAEGGPAATSLEPREKTQIGFSIPEILTSCPNSARLSVVLLKYDDGSIFTYQSPDLNLQSALIAAPLDEVEMNALAIPINFVGTIHLDAEGRAEKVDGIADGDQGTQRFVSRLLAKWRFSPTIKSGNATEGVLDFQLAVGQILPDWNRLQTDALRKRRGILLPIFVVPPSGHSPPDALEVRKRWLVKVGGRTVRSAPSSLGHH